MIEVTCGMLMEARSALQELGKLRLPVVGALRVTRLLKEVQGHLDDVETVRKELLERHGEKGADGQLVIDEHGNVTFADDAWQKFQADYEELMSHQVQIQHSVRVVDLGSIEIAPSTLLALGDLLEDTER